MLKHSSLFYYAGGGRLLSSKEQYQLYSIATQLITKNDFHLLMFNQKEDEVWLEKTNKKDTYVIRLTTKSFDWKNHLKMDVAKLFHQVKMMRKVLTGKRIFIYNLYVSSLTPIDDWSELKRPVRTDEKNSPEMHILYLEEETINKQLSTIDESIIEEPIHVNDLSDVESYERAVVSDKRQLINTYDKQQRELKNIFSAGKPTLTFILIVTNIFMFYLLETSGGSADIRHLIESGANYNPAIMDGEWWRLLSSMFLHIGFFHLLMNMFALYYLGMAVERIFGSTRFIAIYFLAGIGGSVASFTFSPSVSAGASGAIFGLFGALLFFGMNHKRLFAQTMGKNIVMIIGINILIGFLIPQIDHAAHLGGLIFGFIASAIVHLPKKKHFAYQLSSLVVYVALFFSLALFGLHHNATNEIVYLNKIEDHIEDENFTTVVEVATEALNHSNDYEKEILFNRSYAYIELESYEAALDDLEEVISIDDDFSEAHYNLALLYMDMDEMDKAKQSIEKAYDIKPNEQLYEDLYNQLID